MTLAKRYGETQAVDGVSFTLARGESLGLVGESGSGKSTISRLVCRLVDQSAGDILFDGTPIGATPAAAFHQSPFRRRIQIVFQDPGGSLNPRFSAFDSIADPLIRLTGLRNRRALAERVTLCAERAGLSPALLTRFPHQLSGGQKARVGIARAISIEPTSWCWTSRPRPSTCRSRRWCCNCSTVCGTSRTWPTSSSATISTSSA